jgi:excinuclease ABC subunit A
MSVSTRQGFVHVKGAREHNLKNISLDIPRDAMVVFTGISGSGKSSLAFGTLYAEAQRRYLESVSPYARRLFHQMSIPEVDEIEGLPPAVALQQQRGAATTRSSVGSVTTLSNLLRMLYSRAGDYPKNQTILYAESFSPNTPQGACPRCHGLGRIYDVTEKSMVPDDNLTIRERAIAAWPTAWHGQNLRDILVSMGYDVDMPWKEIPKKDRDWILFTEEQPVVPVYAGLTPGEVKRALKQKMPPSYNGTFTSARRHVMQTFANTTSPMLKKRAERYMIASLCPLCKGKRLRKESLSVKFAGYDISAIGALSMEQLFELLQPYTKPNDLQLSEEKRLVTQRITDDVSTRLQVLLRLGLGYLSLDRSTPTLSPGELQRLRLATQVRANLFGVVYVLDEPSAGLHPADTEALLETLDALKAAGNSLFVVEHDLSVIRHADWIVDVGPGAGQHGGEIIYSGELSGLANKKNSITRKYLFKETKYPVSSEREPTGWLKLKDVTRNNIQSLDASFPLGVFTTVTGVSGSGKSSLVSQALIELVLKHLGEEKIVEETDIFTEDAPATLSGAVSAGMETITRLIQVDQKSIGRTPRSNLATYTGLFDHVRKIFATTDKARQRKYDAGRFSFNVAKGRCPNCEGEGFVMVELLFLPSVYSPCPVCHGTRYNKQTLEVTYREKNIADVLAMTVDQAHDFFSGDNSICNSLTVLKEVGLGYLRLGQPATELSGGEAQRIKLAAELQRVGRGNTLYILDEPTTGLHPHDTDKLMAQLHGLVDAGNTVIVVEHNMRVAAGSDWIIDMGPGAGEKGGRILVQGRPVEVAGHKQSMTAKYLDQYLRVVSG